MNVCVEGGVAVPGFGVECVCLWLVLMLAVGRGVVQARVREEQHLAKENSKAGYISAQLVDPQYKAAVSKSNQETMANNARIADEIAHQFDIEKVVSHVCVCVFCVWMGVGGWADGSSA